MRPSSLAASVLLLISSVEARAADPGRLTTVILVRHGEKTADKVDPALTAAGKARANELARVLRDSNLDAVLTTAYARTRMTAAPTAAQAKLKPVELMSSGADYLAEVQALVRGKLAGCTVLVVGHSNTTPELIRKLGVNEAVSLADDEYDRLFVVTLEANGAAKLLSLRYGRTSVTAAGG